MSFAPYIVIWVILMAAAGACLFARSRPRLLDAVALFSPLAAIALWFIFRPEPALRAVTFAGRSLALSATGWQLSGIVLLGLLAGLVYVTLNPQPTRPATWPALALALAATTLSVVWSADDRTRLLSLALFLSMWAVAVWLARSPEEPAPGDVLRSLLRPGAGLFLIWLAGITPARMMLTTLAAAIYLGVWSLGNRRPAGQRVDAVFSAVLGVFPLVAGGAVLSSVMDAAVLSPLVIAFATALGLLSLVVGLLRAWGQTPQGVGSALGMGLAGLALTTAAWAGEDPLVAAVRLAAFAPIVLAMLTPVSRDQPYPWPDSTRTTRPRIALDMMFLAVVYLALAGAPLTVGFVALSRLYDAWQFSGGYVLLAVTVVILSLWLAVIYLTGRDFLSSSYLAIGRARWLRVLVLLVPVVGLVNPAYDVPAGGALVWVALALPLAAGILLGRFVPGLDGLGGLLRESADVRLPSGGIVSRLREASHAAAEAIADALAILDGEYGLLWLLGLLLLLLWIA